MKWFRRWRHKFAHFMDMYHGEVVTVTVVDLLGRGSKWTAYQCLTCGDIKGSWWDSNQVLK